MVLEPTQTISRDEPAGKPSIAVLGTDEVLARRVSVMLDAAGLGMPVTVVADPLDPAAGPAPAVLVIWSGRGITARDALLQRFSSKLLGTHLIVVGPSDSPSSVRAAIEAGAHGLVFEDAVETALAPTIEAVLAGQVAVPARHGRQLDTPSFTPREKQILGLVVLGLSNHEIGAQLFLAESTVKSHLSSAFSRLGVRSRHEAVKMILDPEQRLGLGILGISDTARRGVEVAT